MRTIGTHNEVAHAFAHSHEGFYKGPNMFRAHSSGYGAPVEDYDTVYSYGYHFPIARHVDRNTIQHCILVTTKVYSVSTTKHVILVSRAIPSNIRTFYVDNVNADSKIKHKENYRLMRKEINMTLVKASRARVATLQYLSHADLLRRRANLYTAHFKLGFKLIPEFDASNNELMSKAAAAANKHKAAAVAAAKIKAKQDKVQVRKWVAFETNYCPNTKNVYVRIDVENKIVETSWGMRVDMHKALALYSMAERAAHNEVEWTPSASDHMFPEYDLTQIGGFKVDGASKTGTLRVGCHIMPLKMMRAAYKAAGLV